ncbi:MAG: C39 family peptidase [Candidatus Dependentiae bacterium]
MKRLMTIALCVITLCVYAQKEPWTWHYHKMMPQNMPIKKNEIVFSKIDVPAFTQLLFSWNAFRPQKGHFSFYVQVRNAKQKQWGPWHKMVDWGNNIQKSYESRSDGTCKYLYVRLETEQNQKADAFRIKMMADNADLAQIKSFTVNASDLTKFNNESTFFGSLPSVLVDAVPQKSQLVLSHAKKRMMCSPTSCSMMLEYLTDKKINPLDFAQKSYDYGLNAYGSWPFNTAHAFECADGKTQFYIARLHSFEILHKKLQEGVPVVVSVRGDITGAPKVYNNGHLLVVIGYDAQKSRVICHDPAALTDQETFKEYPMQSFVRAWERSRRLSYIAVPKVA